MTAKPTPAKIEFKPAVREAVGLWVQLIGGSGSGKTYSALRLASGIAGDRPFAFIDTENRRGLHYADQFNFHHADLRAPFRPEAYLEAVKAADAAGYPVIVIDSMSHEWAGDGGVLDWHEEVLDKRAGDDWKKREALKMAAWIEPKMSHKRLVSGLLQAKAHLIICFRAEPKIEMVKENGKTVIQEKHSLTGLNGWCPVSEKNLPFEATSSFMLMPDKPGIPLPIKLQEQHKQIFPEGQLIDETAGHRLSEWAAGSVDELPTKRAAMIEHFGGLGVSVDRILHVVGREAVDDINSTDIAALKSLARDVKDGRQSLLEAFPMLNGETE
jgi:hypothetical protein